ncbi:S66 family peptidase [Methanomassiliicoccus luminyensis]|uniref:S66 family peptidase n=1 Tax=Methanomassiliicoccus luminyensis TaxID=1080712 RepID=UPI00035C8488|nr:S66 peptidase family protein [Methanomassiliicoccus luminyensis]
MVPPIRPPRLKEGGTVAVISPSWGGPHEFPKVYERGLSALRSLGLEIKEMASTRAPQRYLYEHPEARARDLRDAFLDPEVDGIVCSIGGDDSIRLLPFLEARELVRHPKVLMGFSDNTALLAYLAMAGLVTFYGPSVMAGLSQMEKYPRQREHIGAVLFGAPRTYEYSPFPAFSEGYPDWSNDALAGHVSRKKRHRGWKVLQGDGAVRGRLFGGCLEVLEMMKGTEFFPPKAFWKGRILFLETSEEKPTPGAVKCMLRNYGMQGAFEHLAGLIMGRPRDYSRNEKRHLAENAKAVVAQEFGRPDLPVLMDLDFGHTDPQFLLPYNIKAEIDPSGPGFRLLESPVR